MALKIELRNYNVLNEIAQFILIITCNILNKLKHYVWPFSKYQIIRINKKIRFK
jgi:hypothetical protein